MSISKEHVLTIDIKELPDGWSLATLDELIGKSGVFVDGDWIESKDQDPEGDVRLVQLADVGDGLYRNKSARFLTDAKARELKCTFLERGDVLVARMPDPLGRACIFPGDSKKAVTVVDVAIVRPESDFDSKWLMYFVNAPLFRGAVASMESGSTRKRISRKNLEKIAFPVPPQNEQAHIVAEIEKQFSRLDEAITNLKRVKTNLKRYKAAVLKAAVEGKLTEEWRHQHPDVEHADKLLERIPAERRKVAGKGKCKEPVGPDTSGLPELPAGWVWVKLGTLPVDVFDGPFGSNLKSSDYVASGVRVIRLENIGSLEFIDGKESFITEQKFEQLKKHTVRHGDIIFSSFVANETRVVMLPDHIEKAINKADCFCIRVRSEAINNRYLETVLATRTAYEQLVAEVHGATRPRINTTHLKDCQIPFPPIKEQIEIVSKISEMMSVVDVAEAQVVANLRRAERLRQSILKQAFTGQLVPQDQSDEPASVLLERIRTNASVGAQHAAPRSAPRTKTARQGRAQHAAPLRKPRPQPEPAPTASDNFACLDDVTAAILGRMQPGREYARADLADPLGLSTGRWNAAIQELKRQRKVRQLGEKRGARYVRV